VRDKNNGKYSADGNDKWLKKPLHITGLRVLKRV